MAQREIALRARPPQVEEAVAQAGLLAGVDLVFDDEGRRFGRIQDAQFRGEYFHFAAGEFRVGFAAGARQPCAAKGHHVFRAQFLGARMRSLAQLFIENDLRDSAAVAQIDEDEIAKVAPPVHPAHQHDVLVGVGRAQVAVA